MEREEDVSLRIRQASITKNGRIPVAVGRIFDFRDPLSSVDRFIVFWVPDYERSAVRPGRSPCKEYVARGQHMLSLSVTSCAGSMSPHPQERCQVETVNGVPWQGWRRVERPEQSRDQDLI